MHSDLRRELRVQVCIESVMGSSMLGKRKVELLDISNLGCRVSCSLDVPTGTHVVLTMPSLSPISAQVRWSRQGGLGLRFATPLHPLVLERIVVLNRPH
ncbi:PilZ domain-containing protein [Sphingomonas xinjiangensis]|uniref:PilZ domain-containing protein n=1 Tax=Sphingomonas xinjiangensis TaxID=643568 RepID=A0A840YBH9_9SPHN|nr:PilZ domain-containing protein [Sphingomonas xinjiangensis]MBB5709379.1 hypothetical protein [Sphingomonas xinjiangensis]